MDPRAARWANQLVGVWLFVSAFWWPHTSSERTNTWVAAAVTVAVSLIGLRAPSLRFVNTAVGVWLIVSTFALPTMFATTRWNNVIVGLVIGAISLVATPSGEDQPEEPQQRHA